MIIRIFLLIISLSLTIYLVSCGEGKGENIVEKATGGGGSGTGGGGSGTGGGGSGTGGGGSGTGGGGSGTGGGGSGNGGGGSGNGGGGSGTGGGGSGNGGGGSGTGGGGSGTGGGGSGTGGGGSGTGGGGSGTGGGGSGTGGGGSGTGGGGTCEPEENKNPFVSKCEITVHSDSGLYKEVKKSLCFKDITEKQCNSYKDKLSKHYQGISISPVGNISLKTSYTKDKSCSDDRDVSGTCTIDSTTAYVYKNSYISHGGATEIIASNIVFKKLKTVCTGKEDNDFDGEWTDGKKVEPQEDKCKVKGACEIKFTKKDNSNFKKSLCYGYVTKTQCDTHTSKVNNDPRTKIMFSGAKSEFKENKGCSEPGAITGTCKTDSVIYHTYKNSGHGLVVDGVIRSNTKTQCEKSKADGGDGGTWSKETNFIN